MEQNHPNPFNPETQIKFELPLASQVSLRIYDIRGRLVRVLLDREEVAAGFHHAAWNGRDDSGGTASIFIRSSRSRSKKVKEVFVKPKK